MLVASVPESVAFAKRVLAAESVYDDPDFAVMKANGVEWMLHADHTYDRHPMTGVLQSAEVRGCGVELRLHGCDPDQACKNAQAHHYHILVAPTDKPHGVREAFIVAPDGYIWVVDVPLD